LQPIFPYVANCRLDRTTSQLLLREPGAEKRAIEFTPDMFAFSLEPIELTRTPFV
jgi:hypothetical protein